VAAVSESGKGLFHLSFNLSLKLDFQANIDKEVFVNA
jgi:hypothetical protein